MRAREERMAQVPSPLPSGCCLPSSQTTEWVDVQYGPRDAFLHTGQGETISSISRLHGISVAFRRVAYAPPITIATCRKPNKSTKVDDKSLKPWLESTPSSFQSLKSSAEASNTVARSGVWLSGPSAKGSHRPLCSAQTASQADIFFLRWPSRDPLVIGVRVCPDS